MIKGVFKGGGGGSGSSNPPPEIFRFILKSEGKEIGSKKKKGRWGRGGLPLNIFLGLICFRVGLRNFRGWGGVEKFSGGIEKFSGGGVEKFSGGVEKFSGGVVVKFGGGGG